MAEKTASVNAGLGEFFLRDFKRNPNRSITIKNLKAMADAIGVSLDEVLKYEMAAGGTNRLEIGGSRVAEVTPAPIYDSENKPVINLLVAVSVANGDPQLYRTDMVGRQLMLYESDETGRRGAAIAYYPSDKWYSGMTEVSGTSSTCDIVGVVRSVTTLCNLEETE